MRFSSTIDNIHSVEWGLSVNQAYLFSWIYSLPSWAEKVTYDNCLFFYASRHKVITEMPLLTDKPDTVYRYYKQLEAVGLILMIRIDNKDYVTLTDKGKRWNQVDEGLKTAIRPTDNFPTTGNTSENNSENFPTNNNTISNTGLENNIPEKKKAAEKKPLKTPALVDTRPAEENIPPPNLQFKKPMKDCMMEIYGKRWDDPDIRCPNEAIFKEWQMLIDLINKKYSDIWIAARLFTPPEYAEIKEKYGFNPGLFDEILGDICGTGITPYHNLYHRTIMYMKTFNNKKNKANAIYQGNNGQIKIGRTSDYSKPV